eukprot:gene24392-29260_t
MLHRFVECGIEIVTLATEVGQTQTRQGRVEFVCECTQWTRFEVTVCPSAIQVVENSDELGDDRSPRGFLDDLLVTLDATTVVGELRLN